MLRNLKSPETYFQAAFRVQSPWEIITSTGTKEIMKHECYLFDFALDRALKQISDYSCRLNVNESNPEKKVAEFINFLPVLAYDGSTMKQINAQEVLDIAMAGTSATLLAKRWESALLVNVDNDTLSRLLANEEALKALMNIEGFRSLNQDIEMIINKSDKVKKAKQDEGESLTPKQKKELTEEEKEFKLQKNTLDKQYEKYKSIWELQKEKEQYTKKGTELKLQEEDINSKKERFTKGASALNVKPFMDNVADTKKSLAINKTVLEKLGFPAE